MGAGIVAPSAWRRTQMLKPNPIYLIFFQKMALEYQQTILLIQRQKITPTSRMPT